MIKVGTRQYRPPLRIYTIDPLAECSHSGLKADSLHDAALCFWAKAMIQGTCIHWNEL